MDVQSLCRRLARELAPDSAVSVTVSAHAVVAVVSSITRSVIIARLVVVAAIIVRLVVVAAIVAICLVVVAKKSLMVIVLSLNSLKIRCKDTKHSAHSRNSPEKSTSFNATYLYYSEILRIFVACL